MLISSTRFLIVRKYQLLTIHYLDIFFYTYNDLCPSAITLTFLIGEVNIGDYLVTLVPVWGWQILTSEQSLLEVDVLDTKKIR